MIDIRDLKQNPEKYIIAYKNRGANLESEINQAISLYEKYLKNLLIEQEFRTQLNKISDEIGKDPKNTDLKNKASEISTKAKEAGNAAKEIEEEMISLISFFPNVPSDEVPVGKDETENIVIEEFPGVESKNTKPHWEIIEELNLVLNEEAGKISGSRHVIYNDKGAELVKKIEKLMIDLHKEAGYTMIEPPVIVNREALWNTGQLPKFEDDLYKVGEQFLIPTAEVPLTNLAADKIFDESELPKRLYASTSCFRKEAGSAGRDTRGLTRLHQFRKVELVTFGLPKDEEKDFNEMLNQASKILRKLNLKHRHLQLCTGDMGFGSRKTVDIEVWMPGQNRWVEISSVSSVGNFQARRMKARYKDSDNKKELIYTYNGSALAIGRTIAAIIENYYDPETKKLNFGI